MAPPRTFDYDVLNQLIREHPDWSNLELAQVMTDYERKVRHDPKYPDILENSVSKVVSRYRQRWRSEDKPVRERPYGRIIPWPGIPGEYSMRTELRHLRVLARIEAGQAKRVPPRELRQARAFAARLRRTRQVVDITDDGEPYVRPARRDELAHGKIRKLTADVRQDWLDKVAGTDSEAVRQRADLLDRLAAAHGGRGELPEVDK